MDDLGAVTAPAPVLPGHVLADAADIYGVEAVLVIRPDAWWVPVLVSRAERAPLCLPVVLGR